MKMINRHLEAICLRDLEVFPALTLTGPRQSGKSTLLQKLLPDWTYVNLEDPTFMDFATEDPKGFLARYHDQVVFDEIQRVPNLLSYIQMKLIATEGPGALHLPVLIICSCLNRSANR